VVVRPPHDAGGEDGVVVVVVFWAAVVVVGLTTRVRSSSMAGQSRAGVGRHARISAAGDSTEGRSRKRLRRMRFGKNTEKKMMHAAWKAQWMLRKPNQLADRSELGFSALGGDRDAGGGQEALLSRTLMWTSIGGSRPDMWVHMPCGPLASDPRSVW